MYKPQVKKRTAVGLRPVAAVGSSEQKSGREQRRNPLPRLSLPNPAGLEVLAICLDNARGPGGECPPERAVGVGEQRTRGQVWCGLERGGGARGGVRGAAPSLSLCLPAPCSLLCPERPLSLSVSLSHGRTTTTPGTAAPLHAHAHTHAYAPAEHHPPHPKARAPSVLASRVLCLPLSLP